MENQTYGDYATNPTNPSYLHPNENPSLVLVTPHSDKKKYHAWARAMKLSLISKNKLGFIDGSIEPPATGDSLYQAWVWCNMHIPVQRRVQTDGANMHIEVQTKNKLKPTSPHQWLRKLDVITGKYKKKKRVYMLIVCCDLLWPGILNHSWSLSLTNK